MSISSKTFFYLIISVIIFVFIPSFLKNSWRFVKANKRIKETKARFIKIKEENKKLWHQLKYSQSDEFIERQIRDKLQIAKPGELVVVLPPDISTFSAEFINKKENKKRLSNWQKWQRLFFP